MSQTPAVHQLLLKVFFGVSVSIEDMITENQVTALEDLS